MVATGPNPQPLSSTALKELENLSAILHLAHHRNKNQHRRAIWYRSFSMLRRHLGRLVSLYTALASIPDTYAARHRKKAIDRTTQSHIDAVLGYLTETLIPRCHHAFGQLVADLRFAVLGIMLVGVLAQVCAILKIGDRYARMAEVEVQDALRRFELEEYGNVVGSGSGSKIGRHPLRRPLTDDQGEIVSRDAILQAVAKGSEQLSLSTVPGGDDVTLGSSVSDANAVVQSSKLPVQQDAARAGPSPQKPNAASKGGGTEPKRKKQKKRKVGGDAIDDLFDGL